MRRRWWWFSALWLTASIALVPPAPARTVQAPNVGGQSGWNGEVRTCELPAPARQTLELIRKRGPFPYARDGSIFHNREKRLPVRPRNYYTEYTVRTPHTSGRGPRRIVAGKGDTGDPATSGEYYYTPDHYMTFCRIQLPDRARDAP